MAQARLDVALIANGMARSRAVASVLIKSGQVKVNGIQVTKPSQLVSTSASFCVEPLAESQNPENHAMGLVSRAGGKLALAIAELRADGYEVGIDGRDCLDIGASTGGFTQVLLENGAKRVISLDVGHGQLRPELRDNSKVIVMEKVNARYLTAEQLPFRPQLIVCDVSFISLTFVFPAIANVAAEKAQLLLLIKPQFEVGKGNLGKGGIVRDEKLIDQAIQTVTASARENGIEVKTTIPSHVPGANGNQEFFLFGKIGSARPSNEMS